MTMFDGWVTGLQRSGGGVPKLPVERALVRTGGMEGDRQRDRRYHGGPARALCLYSQERLDTLAAEGHPVGPGILGENVTIAGLPWEQVRPGTRLRLVALTRRSRDTRRRAARLRTPSRMGHSRASAKS